MEIDFWNTKFAGLFSDAVITIGISVKNGSDHDQLEI